MELKNKRNKKLWMMDNNPNNKLMAKKNRNLWIMLLGKEKMGLDKIKKFLLLKVAILNQVKLQHKKGGTKMMMYGLLILISNGRQKYLISII